MTSIEVPDWVARIADEAGDEFTNTHSMSMYASLEDMQLDYVRHMITAALGAWVVREGYIAGPELRGLDAARQLGTKFYGTVWSEPTGQAGTPLFTLRQEKPE
jgi:hypothetical protein